MNDHEREKRRAKRMQKQKQKREDRSRPGRGPGDVAKDPARAKGWPAGPCWVSQSWDEPGAKVAVVISRANEAGMAAAATFLVDRSGPGLVEATVRAGLRTEHVTSLAGELGERAGEALIETTAGLAVALVRDAVASGAAGTPKGAEDALELLAGLEASPLDVPFGPPPPPKPRGGLFGTLSRWFGG